MAEPTKPTFPLLSQKGFGQGRKPRLILTSPSFAATSPESLQWRHGPFPTPRHIAQSSAARPFPAHVGHATFVAPEQSVQGSTAA